MGLRRNRSQVSRTFRHVAVEWRVPLLSDTLVLIKAGFDLFATPSAVPQTLRATF